MQESHMELIGGPTNIGPEQPGPEWRVWQGAGSIHIRGTRRLAYGLRLTSLTGNEKYHFHAKGDSEKG